MKKQKNLVWSPLDNVLTVKFLVFMRISVFYKLEIHFVISAKKIIETCLVPIFFCHGLQRLADTTYCTTRAS